MQSCWTCVALVLLVYTLHVSWCSSSLLEKEKQILDNILGPGRYDARIRPSGVNGTDGPTVVHVNTFVRSIGKIDDIKMEYSVQLTFRQSWMDERLKFENPDVSGKIKYLTLDKFGIWMPDLFFSNEKQSHFHNIMMPNMYVRIFPTGKVLYSIRISLTLSCPMNLQLYPLDRQVCSLRMASYGFTTENLLFLWNEGDPVQIVRNLHIPLFSLEKFQTDYCNSKTNTGEYSCLRVDFVFKREFHHYLIQMYIPCCMLVFVSWICFWLDQNDTLTRFFLSLSTLLALALHTSNIGATLPLVNYTMAIDVWTGACLTFVFGALLECLVVNYGLRFETRHKKQRRQCELEHAASLEPAAALLEDGGTTFNMKPAAHETKHLCELKTQPPQGNWIQTWLAKFPTRSKLIDMVSRIAFPVAFALFNLIYWSIYCA